MGKVRRILRRRLSIGLLLSAWAVGQGGCLWVAAGAAAGGAAGYAYYQGKSCNSFAANFEDTWAATHSAIIELGMPISKEERHQACGVIKSQTSDGDRIRIALDAIPSRIPAEGMLTRICIRVGTFGDHPVSERILYQVGAHLAPAQVAGPPPGPDLAPMPAIAPTPIPVQTAEPPVSSPAAPGSPPMTPPLLPPKPVRLP
jgi:Protein of unknown function (DUF3568)